MLPQQAWADPLSGGPGLQLYSVGELLKKDIAGTLSKVHAIGYRKIETAGFANLTTKIFRQALDTAGLRCHSCHFPMNVPDLAPVFQDAHIIGAHYANSAVLLPEGTRPADKQFFNWSWTITKESLQMPTALPNWRSHAGLQYAYHNHNFEFNRPAEKSLQTLRWLLGRKLAEDRQAEYSLHTSIAQIVCRQRFPHSNGLP